MKIIPLKFLHHVKCGSTMSAILENYLAFLSARFVTRLCSLGMRLYVQSYSSHCDMQCGVLCYSS